MKTNLLFSSVFLRSKYINRWVIFISDLLLSCIATFASLFLIIYFLGRVFSGYLIIQILLFSLLCSCLSFLWCRTYKGVIRHSTITEAGRMAVASFFKVVVIVPLLATTTLGLPFKILLLGGTFDFFLTFSALILFRVFLILSYHLIITNISTTRDKILIFVGDNNSISLAGALFSKLGSYAVEGYIRIGKGCSMRAGGYTVYCVRDQLEFNRLINVKGIKSVLFIDRRDVEREQERLVRYCEKKKVGMLLLPSVDEIKNGKVTYRHLPEVRIEDLLGRNEIQVNMDSIGAHLKDRVVMVTGAAGSIGSELCRQLCTFGLKQLILFDSAETPIHNIRLELEDKFPDVKFMPVIGDIRMVQRVEHVMKTYMPQVIFHAAAYKHVPLMEENPCEAVRANVMGTRILADLAVKYGVERFIMISTDKAVNPTNVMGASKRLAEIYVQSLSIAIGKGELPGKTRFITTRFGNVLGSNGSVIPRFREQLAKGGPLTVTHPDIIRYFMTIPEACRLVLEAAVIGQGNEIFVFDMGTPVKIADMAKRMIELAGLVPGRDIAIEYTGLRPGEKLYEELLATKENTLATSNEKIFRAHVREYDYREVADAIEHLIEVSSRVDKMETVREMKVIVPEFKSKNSEYETLDRKQAK
ncbi:UDP-N-acetylglucosamine 4,6-dehydratase family protein [Phocaeicola sp.]